jgi:hypothetical protein
LINLIILREGYKLWSSSSCSFLQPHVTSSLFGPNILLSTLFSNTIICYRITNKNSVCKIYHYHYIIWCYHTTELLRVSTLYVSSFSVSCLFCKY